MRVSTERTAELLSGSFSVRLIADVFYGAERVYPDLPVGGDWELRWDSESRLKSSGTLMVQYAGDLADSMTPTEFTDLLAPFGTELNLVLEVSFGRFLSETFQLGRFVVTAVPKARDSYMKVLGTTLVAGSMVELTLQDPLVRADRAGFHYPQQPKDLASCWGEMQRLTGMQVTRNLPDKPIPAVTLYEPKQGGRLDAVQALARVLGGQAYTSPDNTLTVLPDDWGPTVAGLHVGDRGTVMDVSHSMDSEGVYNEVVGTFERVVDNERTPLYSTAAITTGPLRVDGPYGRHTLYMGTGDAIVNTQAAADAAVLTRLSRASSTQTYRVPVTCILDPRIEDGDVVEVTLETHTLTGRVVNHSFGGNGLMQLLLEVRRPLPGV